MIRVAKGAAPAVLADAGMTENTKNRAAYDLDAQAHLAGRVRLKIERSIYAHADVLEQLVKDQHGKCCYCEVEVEVPYMERDVEHWRPKTAVKDMNGSPRLHPGYFWLAYSWSNLFLACNVCNRLKKREQFPLAVGSTRARSHNDALALERPMLLKPDDVEDPERHIEYVVDQPKGLTPEGVATIKVAGLDRLYDVKRNQHLVRLRRAHGRYMRHRRETSPAALETVREARAELEEASLPEAPFSSMSKAFLLANPLP